MHLWVPNDAVETCRVMPGTAQLHFCSSLLGVYTATNTLVNFSFSSRLPGRASALGRSPWDTCCSMVSALSHQALEFSTHTELERAGQHWTDVKSSW